MLGKTQTTTMLPVVDLERARRFYTQVLGLQEGRRGEDGSLELSTETGGRVALYPREPTKADHTVLSFEVQEIIKVVRDLEGRGVKFEEYDLPQLKTVDKIATTGRDKAAWFKDTEENILCVHEAVPG